MPPDFDSDCIPYAIHILSGIDYHRVCSEARSFGWSEETGAAHFEVVPLARHLGVQLTQFEPIYIDEKLPTLKKILPHLTPSKSYILSVNEHVLSIRSGVVYDKAATHPRTVVHAAAEVVPSLADITATDGEWKLLNDDFRKFGRPLRARCSPGEYELSLHPDYAWAIAKLAEIRTTVHA